jgi:membrane protein
VTGIVGAASLAIFASHVFSLTRRVLNRAFRVAEPRGLFHTFAFDVLSVLLVGGVVVVVIIATIVLVAVRNLAESVLPLPPITGLRRGLSFLAIYALAMATLTLVYRTFPSTRVPARAATIAAVTVTVLWELARFGFATYIHTSGVYGRFYGSFGIWIAGLVWIYYSSAIFVLGAELAAVLSRHGVRP